MSPSNKMKQSKTKAAKYPQPLANTSALERNNHMDSPSNNTSSSASATRTEFRNFIELADSETIKHFITIAASSPEGENLKFLWARAFKEGLVAGHALYGRTEEKLKEAHELGYEQGFKEGGSSKIDLFQAGIDEGRRDEWGDWATAGHGQHCFQRAAIPIHDYYSSSGVQTDTPTFITTSTSTSDTDTTVSEPTPTQTSPPPPTLVIMVSSGTQTQNNDDDSPPLPPVPSTAPVRDPPPKMVPRPPSSAARLNWADDAATSLPILPSNPPPRDLLCLRSSSPKPFSSLQRRNRKPKKYFFQPLKNYNPSSTPRQNNFHTRSLPPYTLSAPFVPKPGRSPLSALNWEDDPRLSDLSQALKALGWIRPPAARAPPW